MRTFSYILLLLTLIGCKVSKDTPLPQQDLPEAYRNAFATDTTTIADLKWDAFFTDPQLQELIGNTIKGNLDLQIAVKNIEASRQMLRQSKWGQVPQLNAYVSASSNIPSENSLNGLSLNNFLGTSHIEDYNAGLSLSWEADIWGKISSRKKEALANYLKTEEAKKLVQANLVASAAQGYYNLLMLDAQLEVALKNRTLSENTVNMVTRQFDAGQVTHLAVEQAEAQRLRAAQIVPQLEKEILLQENALSLLTGTVPGAIGRSGTIANTALHSELPTGIPASILSRRPDVKAQEHELAAANARVGIAKAFMYPALNITANGGLNSFKSDNWFNMPSSLFGLVTGSLAQPLLQGRRLKTQYEVAKTEREKAVIGFRQQVLVAVGEVSDALAEIEKLKEEVAFANERVANLQKAVGNADKLFGSGLASYLEVITAQSNVLQSELDLATVKRNQLAAEVKLYRALGGGWK
ncbi:efflux transporter outer membrane subunit [Flavobacterium sp. MFBS3-15]|uniref:efflux transporter outer membrane subunit n=1 Tax=Flavobacterium sp. MFBS3-15 TaxID=2989816 RepID=UPI00223688E2|nr:efflux transporter outer membrane subunit [Flavobacterium sp. MFBS3-15]MCW4469659.1 efflux transporter outer membrane subunit [Flavobacterium sp. MFBS3-15]